MIVHFSALLILSLISGRMASAGAQLTFTAIPDQDEATLQQRADAVSVFLGDYIEAKCGVQVSVAYQPVSNYQDAVSALLDNVADFGWYGGLTGVQAGLRSPPATYLAQRVEDTEFTSVFIQGPGPQLTGIADVEGKTLAYGSESSTSGHLMPAYYLTEDGVTPASTIYTGSHDATVDAVINAEAEVGALNSVVWANRVASNTTGGTSVFYTTPEYVDYLWVSGAGIIDTWANIEGASIAEGCADVNALLTEAFLAATSDEPLGEALLTAYSTVGYVSIEPNEYDPIEETGCALGMIEEQYCSEPVPEDLGNVGAVAPAENTGAPVNSTDIPADNDADDADDADDASSSAETDTPPDGTVVSPAGDSTSGAHSNVSGILLALLSTVLMTLVA